MIETFLIGSVGQLLERIRQLRQIVQGTYRREYDGLRQKCLMQLDAVQAALQYLAGETIVDIAIRAFAWSHYHLCVERGGDPFETPFTFESTQSADNARMCAALKMLVATGFKAEVELIEKAWHDFVEVMGYQPESEYWQCYPEPLITKILLAAKDGIEGIGVVTAKPSSLTPIVDLLIPYGKNIGKHRKTTRLGKRRNLKLCVNLRILCRNSSNCGEAPQRKSKIS